MFQKIRELGVFRVQNYDHMWRFCGYNPTFCEHRLSKKLHALILIKSGFMYYVHLSGVLTLEDFCLMTVLSSVKEQNFVSCPYCVFRQNAKQTIEAVQLHTKSIERCD